jgi:hypothetical protein
MTEPPGAQAKGPGHVAGIVAGILAVIVINALGKGDAIGGRFITGFIVGGGTYFVVALLVDLLFASRQP